MRRTTRAAICLVLAFAFATKIHSASVLTPVGDKVRLGNLDEYSIVVQANAPLLNMELHR